MISAASCSLRLIARTRQTAAPPTSTSAPMRIVSHLPFTVSTDVGVDIGIIHQPSVRLQPPLIGKRLEARQHGMLLGCHRGRRGWPRRNLLARSAEEVGLEAYARLVNDPDVNSHIRIYREG